MQTAIDEVRGEVEEQRPVDGVCGIRGQCHVMAQKLNEGWGGEAFIAYLHAMTNGSVWSESCRMDLDGGAAFQAGAVQASE